MLTKERVALAQITLPVFEWAYFTLEDFLVESISEWLIAEEWSKNEVS